MKILHFLIIIVIMFASCFVLPDIHAQDCMGGPFCGGNTPFAPTLNRNVTVSLNFHSNYTLPNNVHYLWLRFFDAKNNELIKNVSFFINATKDNKVLMHELFYTKTGFMLMKFHPDLDTGKLIINGTSEPTLGGMMSENDTLPITTSVFATNGTYHIHLEVLTMDYPNNIIDQNNPPTFNSWWLVDEKGNISKYDSHAIGIYFQLENNAASNKIQSPLQQFKSGIAAKDVKCNEGLELLMKSYDNMPACVKSTSIQRLLGQGWINPYNFNGENIGKESISLSAYQGVSSEAFYNNGTVASDFTINVNINNFKPSNASLVLQVYYNDRTPYKTVTVSSDSIQPDGFYKYHLIAVSDKNHPPPFKVVATYNNETAIAYAPVFAHP